MFSKTTCISIFTFVVAITATSTLFAHPFHVCVGQMQWNSSSKTWEVSIRLDPRDLESAMSVEFYPSPSDQKISVGDDKFTELATRYLNQHFFILRTPIATSSSELDSVLAEKAKSNPLSQPESQKNLTQSADRSSITWIGMEPEKGWLWLHFEMSQPEIDPAEQKLWLIHRLLLDAVENQENSILVDSRRSPRFSLQFQLRAEAKELKKTSNAEKPVAIQSEDSKQ